MRGDEVWHTELGEEGVAGGFGEVECGRAGRGKRFFGRGESVRRHRGDCARAVWGGQPMEEGLGSRREFIGREVFARTQAVP